jgi:uncharacterized caspase-like protein
LDIEQWVKVLSARQVLVMIDACHSGLTSLHRDAAINKDLSFPDGKVWLGAGGADELAFEDDKIGHGAFTGAILEGLNGRADFNSDGLITAEELFRYVTISLASSERLGNLQHPLYAAISGSGDFPIAQISR